MQSVMGLAQSVLQVALSNAALAGVAALLAWAFSRLWRKPALSHALWLIVLLKLLTPPVWKLPIHVAIAPRSSTVAAGFVSKAPIQLAEKGESFVVSKEAVHSPDLQAFELHQGSNKSNISDVSEPDSIPGLPAPEVPHVTQHGDGESIAISSSLATVPPAANHEHWTWSAAAPVALTIWLSGALVCLAISILRIMRFHRTLRFGTKADGLLQAQADHLARKMGLQAAPTLWLVCGAVCPMLWAGWGRARVLLPRELFDRLDESQQRALLIHELAHRVRRDHWIRYVELVATSLYWWNPICWWARRHLREAEEQCCDAWVMALMPGSFKQYAHALLEAVDWISAPRGGGSRPGAVPMLASGMGQFTDLKRRLTMLKQGNVSQSLGLGGLAATLALAASLLPVMPTFAQTAPEAAPPPAQKDQTTPATPEPEVPPAAPGDRAVEAAPDAGGPIIPPAANNRAPEAPGKRSVPFLSKIPLIGRLYTQPERPQAAQVAPVPGQPGVEAPPPVDPAIPAYSNRSPVSTAAPNASEDDGDDESGAGQREAARARREGAAAQRAARDAQRRQMQELAQAQREVQNLQRQLNDATHRLQKLQADIGSQNTIRIEGDARFFSDGKGSITVLSPDGKMRIDLPKPASALPSPKMDPNLNQRFNFRTDRSVDVQREERMRKLEAELSELMKAVDSLRSEIHPDGQPDSGR